MYQGKQKNIYTKTCTVLSKTFINMNKHDDKLICTSKCKLFKSQLCLYFLFCHPVVLNSLNHSKYFTLAGSVCLSVELLYICFV